jgi:hypothetical protein
MNEEQGPVDNSSTRLSPPNAASYRLCELDRANNETVASTSNKVSYCLATSAPPSDFWTDVHPQPLCIDGHVRVYWRRSADFSP